MRLFQKGVTVGERSPDVEDAGKNKVSSTLGHVRWLCARRFNKAETTHFTSINQNFGNLSFANS